MADGLSLGDVFGEAVRRVRPRPGALVAIVALLMAANAAWGYGGFRLGFLLAQGMTAGEYAIIGGLARTVVQDLIGLYFHAAMLGLMLDQSRASLMEALQRALLQAAVHYPALLLIRLATMIAGTVGLLLLIVPGVYGYVRWGALAVPIQLQENRSPIDAFARSDRLSRGGRWTVFWALATFSLLTFIVTVATGYLLVAVARSSGAAPGPWTTPLFYAVPAVTQALVLFGFTALTAGLYARADVESHGLSQDAIDTVFA